jgi:hypothetical protein
MTSVIFRPAGAWLSFAIIPTACAVGCILAPLRGSISQQTLRVQAKKALI